MNDPLYEFKNRLVKVIYIDGKEVFAQKGILVSFDGSFVKLQTLKKTVLIGRPFIQKIKECR